jgi:death-on-curing family protein
MATNKISIESYLALYENSVLFYRNLSEPIPEIHGNSIKNVEYILGVPFQRVFGKVAYWGFYKKAAVLFYLMIKNHPLENGNKRLACMSLDLFYNINNRILKITDKEMYDLSIRVATSDAKKPDNTINEIKIYLKSKK